ncbi:RNA-directed DNA polymerase from mobile element jockey [Trichonephila clavipes]|nr:RNA-directed DNA polymerase from mobile element jockey [Trichonephila clavipes]
MALDNHTDMDFTPQSPLSSASNGTAPTPCEELTSMKIYLRRLQIICSEKERTVSLLRQDKGHHESDTLYQLAWNEYQDVQSSLQQAVSDFDSLPCTNPGCSHHVSPKSTPKNTPPPSPTRRNTQLKRKDDDDFEFPPTRKTARKAILQDSQEIGIENQFSLLPNVIIKQVSGQLASSAAKNSESTTTANQNNRSNALPPPLMLKTDENYRVQVDTIKKVYPHLRLKTTGEYIKLYSNTTEQNRIVRQTLIELGYRFYDLEKEGFEPDRVTQLVGRRTKQLLPIFQVTLPRTIENLKIFDLKTLAHLNITVDGYNGRGVTQCFSCNNFHHNADNCYLKPRCLKCGEEHLTKDCPIKQRLETKFCINCQVYGHMANWYGCPCFPKPPKGTAKVNRNSYTNSYNSLIRPNLSYAQATTGKPATTNKKPQQMAPRRPETSRQTETVIQTPSIQNHNVNPQISTTQNTNLNLNAPITNNNSDIKALLSTTVQCLIQLLNAMNTTPAIANNFDTVNSAQADANQINDRPTSNENYRAFGGTLILIKNSIKHYSLPTPSMQTIEATIVILTPIDHDPISIVSIYIPPRSDEYTFTIDIENLIQTSSNCVLFGDFNAPHTAWNCNTNSSRGVRLLDYVNMTNLYIAYPDSPTSNENWSARLKALDTQDNSLWAVQKFLKNKRSDIPPLNCSSGTAVTDTQKANILAESILDNFTENSRPNNDFDNDDELINNTVNTFLSLPTSTTTETAYPSEIISYIKKSNSKKAPGKDGISNRMTKNFSLKAILILTILINKILTLNYFPKAWKEAIIFPILKPGKNKNIPSSYRPISLLSTLSKITESIILTRLKEFLYTNNIINPNQYGFTNKLSTLHPLLNLTEAISEGFQSKKSTGAVFLDIQKAFDRVWLTGLTYKLINYKIPPPLVFLLHSYNSNRSYQVRVKDTLSTTKFINCGVAQGSLLGPLLFNLYINDIPEYSLTKLNMYADDTAVHTTFKRITSVTFALNKHLKLLENYYDRWKISINVEKSAAVLFTKKRKIPPPPKMYNTTIPWSQSTKYLGITFDKNLTWKTHIQNTRKKFRKLMFKLFPLIGRNSDLSRNNKVLLFTAVMRPILSYGCPVWGYAAKTNINNLDTLQNSTIRMIVKASRYMRNDDIRKALKIKSFKFYIQKIAKSSF